MEHEMSKVIKSEYVEAAMEQLDSAAKLLKTAYTNPNKNLVLILDMIDDIWGQLELLADTQYDKENPGKEMTQAQYDTEHSERVARIKALQEVTITKVDKATFKAISDDLYTAIGNVSGKYNLSIAFPLSSFSFRAYDSENPEQYWPLGREFDTEINPL